jgi:hypothetical protein
VLHPTRCSAPGASVLVDRGQQPGLSLVHLLTLGVAVDRDQVLDRALPRREEYTICTPVAPEYVFAVRTSRGSATRLVRNPGPNKNIHAGQRITVGECL